MAKYYTASKRQVKGRDGWAVIFRHPARPDRGTGRPGLRVHRGLSTSDETEADSLVAELNEILSSPELWQPTARSTASARFDDRVVAIFYEGHEGQQLDFAAVREEVIPLPGEAEGYKRVLLLGTTGAGKTTALRQFLGTLTRGEQFPSTSTAKTTIADTEIIVCAGDTYDGVVTFAGRDEVVDHLTDNASAAALAVFLGKGDPEVRRRLLDHVDQRFRFSYVLGRAQIDEDDDFEDEEEELDDLEPDPQDVEKIDVDATLAVVDDAVAALRRVVDRHAADVRAALDPSEGDERIVQECIEENLDTDLRGSDDFNEIVDSLLSESEKRFDLLEPEAVTRNRQGWPVSWTWACDDRSLFLKTVLRFWSNHAPLFGRLLTPLVNGVRVRGPFRPDWAETAPQMVFVDGEGLGHSASSTAALSSSVAQRIEDVDHVLLVDNAMQPMQAAPISALKSIAVSGNGRKLFLLFTHLDEVRGPNLRGYAARVEHVLASAEGALNAVGEDLGPAAERVLRSRIDSACFFPGDIRSTLDPSRGNDRRSIEQLGALLESLAEGAERAETGPSRPVFDRMNLSLAIAEAAKSLHARWRGLLGLRVTANAPKEHWTRIKALNRRLAEGWATDEYDTLRPVADLRHALQRQVYLMLQRPVRWEGGEPDEDQRQAAIDEIANAITKRLFSVARHLIIEEVRKGWQDAYQQRGSGSTFVRAQIIAADVFDRGAPVPTVAASPDQNRFLRAVAAAVDGVAEELGFFVE